MLLTFTHLYKQLRQAEWDFGHGHIRFILSLGLQERHHINHMVLRDTLGIVGIPHAQHLLVNWTHTLKWRHILTMLLTLQCPLTCMFLNDQPLWGGTETFLVCLSNSPRFKQLYVTALADMVRRASAWTPPSFFNCKLNRSIWMCDYVAVVSWTTTLTLNLYYRQCCASNIGYR